MSLLRAFTETTVTGAPIIAAAPGLFKGWPSGRQEAAGLDVVTDGEQRRYAFFGHLI